MLNILHVSDFHFNINQEESEDRLTKLVYTINKLDFKIDIIVFSGDIIDARIIKDQCIKNFIDFHRDLFDRKDYSSDEFDNILLEIKKKSLIDEFTKLLMDVTTKEFNKAKISFEKFYKELDVKLEDIILCCGNHDRVRIIGESNKCLKERMIDERIFSCFNQFCQSLGLSYGANTIVHTSKGYKFIIANSNWSLEDKKSVCFNCQELQHILSELDDNTKSRNIFVSHQPISDFCENQKINYSSDLYNMGVEATIKEKCGTLLFGDKHGRQINDFDNLECICGAPLHSDVTTYNILKCIDDLDNGKPFLYKSIVWNKNNGLWDIFPCNSEFKSFFSESYNQFSKLTLQYLGENFNFDNRQTLNTDKVSQLFKLICKIKESEKSTKILSCEDNIFDYTVNLIENNVSFNNAINLKGMPKMGKTFYLNILYLTMFNRYMDGKSNYFPIYFNVDKLITDEIETFEQFYNKVNSKFDLIIKKLDIIKTKYDCNVILLIDGLNQKNVFKLNNNIVEKTLFKKIKMKNDLYYILTFNISNFPNQNYSINNIDIKCKYLIYFNLIDIVLVDKKSTKIENIIQLISEIFNVTNINIKDFYEKILSLHTCNLDLRTLYRYTKYHSSISDEINLDINIKALKEDFDRIVKFDEEYSCKCAYFLLMSGQTYDKYSKMPFYMFWKLKNNINLLSYMTANFYIKEIENYIEYQNQGIFTDSILVRFIPRSIALLIRKILSINKSDNILGKFIDIIYEKDISIPHITHSMLYYLVGHLNNNDMFNKVNKIKSSDIVGMSKDKRDFFEFCKERSKKIAKVLYEKSTSKNYEENELISSLLKDCKFRENNRLYQILYYGDT